MNIQKLNKTWSLVATSSGILSILVIAMLCPLQKNDTNAIDCTTSNPTNCANYTTTTRANVSVEPVISLALQPTINIDVTPTVDGSFKQTTASLAVSTNNTTGYSVYLQSGDGNALNNSIKNSTINPISSSSTQANFTNNTWGYNLGTVATDDGTIYQPIPNERAVIASTEAPTDTNYNFTLATKVDTSIPSGTYTNTIIVSAVANPVALKGLLSIDTMQQMTPTVCSESDIEDTKQLTDTRDNKSYWVAKLTDGNCWMTQNLDLDITTSGLETSNTDITNDWTSKSPYPPTNTMSLGNAVDTNMADGSYSWNVGRYQIANPSTALECGNDITSLNTCITTGKLKSNISDAHYTLGNYYNFNAATAGTGGGLDVGQTASGSICPKGWQLPTGQPTNHYKDLIDKYNITVSNVKEITKSPLYFTYSGMMSDNGTLNTNSGFTEYATATINPSYRGSIYGLTISPTSLNTGTSPSRNDTYLIRCLAR